MPIGAPETYRKIFVAGHRGMAGSALCRRLRREAGVELVTAGRDQLNLLDRAAVDTFFRTQKPDAVIFAAAKVGGIAANHTYPVEFLTENILMAIHAISAAHEHGVKRLLFLGSNCIYPRDCPQPIREESLLSGPLESTNEAYALAKIAGLKLCQYYRQEYGAKFNSVMPTNLYGPGDNYHPERSHVLPALVRRFHEAKVNRDPAVTIWGTGKARREFLHVDDLADALVHLLPWPSGGEEPADWTNVGTGIDLTILELASLIAETVGFQGKILTDPTRPDGTPVKRTDVARLHRLGWRHQIDLREGLKQTYQSFLQEQADGSLRET